MKNRSGEKIKLASIDELLGVVNEESAMEIEISKIHPFKNHPFKVLDDEKMQDLVESVKINGVLTPVLLRMDDNEEYEMVSGHRRMHAAQLAGLTTIPAIVRELSDDDAIVAMHPLTFAFIIQLQLVRIRYFYTFLDKVHDGRFSVVYFFAVQEELPTCV